MKKEFNEIPHMKGQAIEVVVAMAKSDGLTEEELDIALDW